MYLTAYQSGFPLFGSLFTLIVKLFGYLMNGIYIVLDKIGIPNVGLAIIIFTLITRIILYPSTVKQQKSSKIMNIIQPEIKAIQAKYEGQNDQQSMMMQQQSSELWHTKQQLVKRQAEEAASKLLLPMAIMFIGVLIMIIVPLFTNMGL